MNVSFSFFFFLEMRVDWRMFNLVEDDRKLVDLQIIFGDAFPILDPSGAEVIPDDSCHDDATVGEEKTALGDPETGEGPSQSNALLSKITNDLEAREKQRPKVLSVLVREHEGCPADGPFCIDKNQMVRSLSKLERFTCTV